MEFYIEIPEMWMWFGIALGLVLITSKIMGALSKNFQTRDGSNRSFSIMDLEFPSSPQELINIIHGVYRLPEDKPAKVISALKKNIYIDFIFMPGIYGMVFILCMLVSSKTDWIGHPSFAFFGWLQLLAWAFDIIENLYLLNKIKSDSVVSSKGVFNLLRYMIIAKWGIAMLGGICSLMVLFYFWLTGNFYQEVIGYLGIYVAEVVAVMSVGSLFRKKGDS